MSIYIRYYEDLWRDTSLSHTDVLALNKILSLSNIRGYYFGSYAWLADYLRISQRRLKDVLNNLEKKGYIELLTLELKFGLTQDIIRPTEKLWAVKRDSRESGEEEAATGIEDNHENYSYDIKKLIKKLEVEEYGF